MRELVDHLILLSPGSCLAILVVYGGIAFFVPQFLLNSICFDPEACSYIDLVTRLWWRMSPIFFIFTVPAGLAADVTAHGPYVLILMSAIDAMSFYIMMSGCTGGIRLRLWRKSYFYYALQRDKENGRHPTLTLFYIYLLQLFLFLGITNLLFFLYCGRG